MVQFLLFHSKSRIVILLFAMALSSRIAISQNHEVCLTFEEIRDCSKQPVAETAHKGTFRYFDFNKMEPSENLVTAQNYFEIGYDKSEQINLIEYHGSNKLSYKLQVIRASKFLLFKVQVKDQRSWYFPPFVLIKFNGAEGYYTVNYKSQTSFESPNNYKTESFNDIDKVEEVSSLMHLTGDLTPDYEIRFSNGYIIYKSIFEFDENINKENAVFYDFDSVKRLGSLTNETCLDSLFSKTEGGMGISASLVLLKSYISKTDIWLYGGAHKFK
jgi:hypothetical protein